VTQKPLMMWFHLSTAGQAAVKFIALLFSSESATSKSSESTGALQNEVRFTGSGQK
jgi:hypothetical protein